MAKKSKKHHKLDDAEREKRRLRKDIIDVIPKGVGGFLLEAPWIVKNKMDEVLDIHPSQSLGPSPLLHLVNLIKGDAKKILATKSEKELLEEPFDFDTESAMAVIEISKEINRRKLSKQSHDVGFLMVRLISACIRMEVIDFIENEINLRAGRKKAGRRPKRAVGVFELIKKRLKDNPNLAPRRLWMELSHYNYQDSFEGPNGFTFFMDGEDLVEEHPTPMKEDKRIKFRTFREYFTRIKKIKLVGE